MADGITDAMVLMALTRLMADTGLPFMEAYEAAERWMGDHPAKTIVPDDIRLEAAAAACFETYRATIQGDDAMRWPDDPGGAAEENFRRIATATVEAYEHGRRER